MREIRFRAWSKISCEMFTVVILAFPFGENRVIVSGRGGSTDTENDDCILMQFTGLLDKNGLADIYEGDILDENGVIRGNVYESPQVFREGIDFVIAGMGTSAWRSSESIAMGRGCKYTE